MGLPGRQQEVGVVAWTVGGVAWTAARRGWGCLDGSKKWVGLPGR